ncbi:hypothetical protein KA047_01535 [Candidatus Saccharibacteria bacterium]|nr:hypothetical protein [Candidatus Saccharibacteria bacterium]
MNIGEFPALNQPNLTGDQVVTRLCYDAKYSPEVTEEALGYLFAPARVTEPSTEAVQALGHLKGAYVSTLKEDRKDDDPLRYDNLESAVMSGVFMTGGELPAESLVDVIGRLTSTDRAEKPIVFARAFESALNKLLERANAPEVTEESILAPEEKTETSPTPAPTGTSRYGAAPKRSRSTRTMLNTGNVPYEKPPHITSHAANVRRLHAEKGFDAEKLASMYGFEIEEVEAMLHESTARTGL